MRHIIDRQKGSHVTLIREQPFARVTVPEHRKGLKPGTMRSIIRDAGLALEQFSALLKGKDLSDSPQVAG